MVHYARRIVAPVPLEDAFAYLSRFSSAAEWDPSVRAARMLTSEPVRRGSVFALDVVFMAHTVPLEYEIIELDPPERVVLAAENASARSTDEIRFTSEPSGATAIEYSATLDLKGIARLATPIFALVLRRIGERAAVGLQEALTARAVEAPGQQA